MHFHFTITLVLTSLDIALSQSLGSSPSEPMSNINITDDREWRCFDPSPDILPISLRRCNTALAVLEREPEYYVQKRHTTLGPGILKTWHAGDPSLCYIFLNAAAEGIDDTFSWNDVHRAVTFILGMCQDKRYGGVRPVGILPMDYGYSVGVMARVGGVRDGASNEVISRVERV